MTPERIRENIQIFDFELEPADVARIDGLDRGSASASTAPTLTRSPTSQVDTPYGPARVHLHSPCLRAWRSCSATVRAAASRRLIS